MAENSSKEWKTLHHPPPDLYDSKEEGASNTSKCASLIGSVKGKLKVSGDILSTAITWNAES